jgi:hypothetical protein
MVFGAVPPDRSRRERAAQAVTQRNYKDAYEAYRALALDPAEAPRLAGEDLKAAIACLVQLGRLDEVDKFRLDLNEAYPVASNGENLPKNSKSSGVFRGIRGWTQPYAPRPREDFE